MNRTDVDDQIRTAWNPNGRQFDAGTLIAGPYGIGTCLYLLPSLHLQCVCVKSLYYMCEWVRVHGCVCHGACVGVSERVKRNEGLQVPLHSHVNKISYQKK